MTLSHASILCICGNPQCDIPFGLCHCGCGKATKIPKRNDKYYGYIAGVPRRFCLHHRTLAPPVEDALPFKIDGVYCRLLPLTRGAFAIIDATDYRWLMRWKWSAFYHTRRKVFYGCRDNRYLAKRRILLHRFILDAPQDMLVDHANGNTLDCRRKNLRLATHRQNQYNKPPQNNNRSGYKGVYKRTFKTGAMFVAHISNKGKSMIIGKFHNPEDAARAYDVEASRLFGEFAWLNFPVDSTAV